MMYEAWGWPQWVMTALYLLNFVVLASREEMENRNKKVLGTIFVVWTLYMGGFWDA